MGIRFRCPQGHQLHVKSFLAGKTGVCPDCGARVRIPAASTIRRDGSAVESGAAASTTTDDEDAHEIPPETPAMKSGEDLRDAVQVPKGAAPPQAFTPAPAPVQPANPAPSPASATAAPVRPAAVVPARVAPGSAATGYPAAGVAVPVGGVPSGVPVGVAPVGGATAVPVAGAAVRPAAVPVGGPARVAAVPIAGAAPVASPAPYAAPPSPPPTSRPDPIGEAPHAVWYVRPAAGGQYGPARGDIFRQWVGQGRVAPDSLVWREGWADWRPAAGVFPEMQGALADPGLAALGGGVGLASAEQSTAKYLSRKRSSTVFGVGMIVMLGLLCAVLIGVMIYVVSQQM